MYTQTRKYYYIRYPAIPQYIIAIGCCCWLMRQDKKNEVK